MKIHWLIPGTFSHIETLSESQLASNRMRAGLVEKYSPEIQIEFSAGDRINTKVDVIVVGKIGRDCQNGRDNLWLSHVSEGKKNSTKIVIDYSDNHLELPESPMHDFYKKVLPYANQAIVPSEHMSIQLKQLFNKRITIIEDPVEIAPITPRLSIIQEDITFLWFGHASNISYLIRYLQNKSLCDINININILSNIPGLELISSQKQNLRSNLNLSEWTLENMIHFANKSDACLIPSDLNDVRKSGVSSNRLITAFALGLPVSADILQSYAPYSEYFQDIRIAPLSAFIKKINLYMIKSQSAQLNIVPRFSRDAIVQKWKFFFNNTIYI
jgi:hypothetical protein